MIEILISGNKETNCVMIAYDKKLMCIQKEIDEDVYVNINGRRILVDREKDSCIGTMGDTKVYMKLDELIKLANTEVKTYAEELEQQYKELKEKYNELAKKKEYEQEQYFDLKFRSDLVNTIYNVNPPRKFKSKKEALKAENKIRGEIIKIKGKEYIFDFYTEEDEEIWYVYPFDNV